MRLIFLNEAMAGSGRFLPHGRVLLRALIHCVDRRVDLLQCGGLFAGGLDDGVDMTIDLLHLIDDHRQSFGRL